MNTADYWAFLPLGYLVTVAIETPVLMIGLSRRHPWSDRLLAGLWLTACTYPIVVIVLPLVMRPGEEGGFFGGTCPRWVYLAVAETFAPIAECGFFWLAYGSKEERWKRSMWQDLAVVTLANLASFLIGEYTGLVDVLGRAAARGG